MEELKKDKIILEICIDSVESALAAKNGGADRVELCANLLEGGTTPSAGMIKACRKIEGLDLFVMIRPRGGDFLYFSGEFEVMKEDILMAKKLGVDGVVFGLLLAEGNIDLIRTKKLTELARPMQVTFHRAFDMCKDPLQALEELKSIGVDRILTSGQQPTAFQGKNIIKKLVKQADEKITILAGAGVNESNIEELCKATQCKEFHFSAKTTIPSVMKYRNPALSMGRDENASEFDRYQSDEGIIRKIKSIVNKI